MGYKNPVWHNGTEPAINDTRLNDLCDTVERLDFADGRVVVGQKSGETLGQSATSEGVNTVASGGISHAEGSQTTASGYCSHSEGFNTLASGTNSHAEGASTNADGNSSHAEGFGTEARGAYQHVFGMFNALDPAGDSFDPSEKGTYAEIVGNGDAPTSSGRSNARTLDWDGNEVLAGSITPNGGVKGYVIAGQKSGTTLGNKATAEGYNTTASAAYCHAEGWGTTASKTGAHSEGYNTVASESYSHAEGYESEASDGAAHAEGWGTTASGNYSHSEGADTTSSGAGSHAEGNATTASGNYSHAEGQNTLAQGKGSHAEGAGTIATDDYQHVFGKYNIAMSGYAEIVGWGTSDTARNFIRTLDTSGNMMISGSLTQGSDARLKVIDGDVPDVSDVHAVQFRWNDGRDDLYHVGYIAQDVEKVAPHMVKNNEDGYKSLDYIALLCAKMELLERRVKELEEEKE